MKYAYLLIASIVIFFASCKNEKYTCQCTSGWGGDYRIEMKKRNMQAATNKCNSFNQPQMDDGNYGCHLVDNL